MAQKQLDMVEIASLLREDGWQSECLSVWTDAGLVMPARSLVTWNIFWIEVGERGFSGSLRGRAKHAACSTAGSLRSVSRATFESRE